MLKLNIAPDDNGYSFQMGNEYVSATLASGFSRTRKDVEGAAHNTRVQWTVQGFEYQYLVAFYKVVGAGTPFLIDLLIDSDSVTEYEVKFVAGTFSLPSTVGLLNTISAELEVKPQDDDEEYLLSVVTIGGLEDAGSWFGPSMNEIANEEMPEHLGA